MQEGLTVKVLTRSKRIKSALTTVLNRLPSAARIKVEGFLFRITTNRGWRTLGLGDFDPSSAVVAPLFLSLDQIGTSRYKCQLYFNLPIVRLFSNKALIGIVAHELAHVHIAAELGKGWHEKMKRRERAYELAANRLAERWGFAAEIARMHEERLKKVNLILDKRARCIMTRINTKYTTG